MFYKTESITCSLLQNITQCLKLVFPCCLELGPPFGSFPCKLFLNFTYVFNDRYKFSSNHVRHNYDLETDIKVKTNQIPLFVDQPRQGVAKNKTYFLLSKGRFFL